MAEPRPAIPGRQAPPSPYDPPAAPAALTTHRFTTGHLYGMALGLFLVTGALGQVGTSLARPVFVAGCLVAAHLAYRSGGLSRHAELCIILFVFAPFLRRWVDVHAGYDASGSMLVGPLLALVAAFAELRRLLSDRLVQPARFLPVLLILPCIAYGWTISAFQDSLMPSSIAAAKDLVPLLYSVCLMLRPDESGAVLRAAARAFLIVSPVIGVYGIAQHLSPPSWDRYWMISSKMLSIGEPLPGQVRVFSTMNSPASFAFYATTGLLLFSFTRSVIPSVLVPVVALLPLSVALLLSGVRTAWIGAAVGLAFCALFRRTRARTGLLALGLAAGLAATLLLTTFADSVASRLGSMAGGVSQDGSGSDRVHDYIYVFTEGTRYLFGVGLTAPPDPQLMALDGLLLTSVTQMGLVVGVLHVGMVMWAGAQALAATAHRTDTLAIVAGAVIAGNMAAFLLVSFTQGELGFLFWMLVGALTVGRPDRLASIPSTGVTRWKRRNTLAVQLNND